MPPRGSAPCSPPPPSLSPGGGQQPATAKTVRDLTQARAHGTGAPEGALPLPKAGSPLRARRCLLATCGAALRRRRWLSQCRCARASVRVLRPPTPHCRTRGALPKRNRVEGKSSGIMIRPIKWHEMLQTIGHSEFSAIAYTLKNPRARRAFRVIRAARYAWRAPGHAASAEPSPATGRGQA